jgi:hypothetical protein
MSENKMEALPEVINQLLATASAVGPFLTTKLPILPFVNPQICNEMWPISTVIAAVSGFVSYRMLGGRIAALGSVVIAVASISIMVAITEGPLFSAEPGAQRIWLRITFVILFSALATAVGASLGRPKCG